LPTASPHPDHPLPMIAGFFRIMPPIFATQGKVARHVQ
jgi:hypothetical protein